MMKSMPDMTHDDPNAKQVAPKARDYLVWHFNKAGEFDFACLIPGQREAGMTGKIVVKWGFAQAAFCAAASGSSSTARRPPSGRLLSFSVPP